MHAALRSGLIAEVDRVRDLWGLDAELQPSRCVQFPVCMNSLCLVCLPAKHARSSGGVFARAHMHVWKLHPLMSTRAVHCMKCYDNSS